MSDTTPAQGWSELLLAPPEFDLIDAGVDEAEVISDVTKFVPPVLDNTVGPEASWDPATRSWSR